MDKIEIPLSKTKMFVILCGSIMFVFAGYFMLKISTEEQTIANSIPHVVLGGIAVLFFGFTGAYSIKKMFDTKMGLIIDDDGIHDNTHSASVGLIKWEDIVEIKTEEMGSQSFLMIYVSNLENYLDEVKGVKKKILETNDEMYGTPLSITSIALKCEFYELEKLVYDRFAEYRQRKLTE